MSQPTLEERALLNAHEIASGYRLACQAKALEDITLDIPKESLTTLQRLQLEGRASEVRLGPALEWIDISIPPASLDDLRADTTRLRNVLAYAGWNPRTGKQMNISPAVLAILSDRMREQNWTGRVVRRGDDIIAFLPTGSKILGLAVDIGTTKLAAYLVDLATGKTLAKAGATRPVFISSVNKWTEEQVQR